MKGGGGGRARAMMAGERRTERRQRHRNDLDKICSYQLQCKSVKVVIFLNFKLQLSFSLVVPNDANDKETILAKYAPIN